MFSFCYLFLKTVTLRMSNKYCLSVIFVIIDLFSGLSIGTSRGTRWEEIISVSDLYEI